MTVQEDKRNDTTISQERINQHISNFKERILSNDSAMLDVYPIETYTDEIINHAPYFPYFHLSEELKRSFEKILADYNINILALYHKLALSILIKHSIEKLKIRNIPNSILLFYHKWFDTVLKDFELIADDYYDHKNDPFLKDLGVCGLRLIPVGGASVVEVSGPGIKRGFGHGLRHLFEYFTFLLFKAGGRKPFYLLHLVDRYASEFKSDEMDKAYIRLSELLKVNPKMKGVMRFSWWFDPKLENISPHLAWLRQRPVENGGKLFRVGPSEFDTKMATLKSKTRRKLYEEGKYIPTKYAMIWPRKGLIKWADMKSKSNT
jgi:hypothetical protein